MYVIIFVSTLVAFVLSALCGGGAGLILIPILGHFLPLKSVPAALAIGTATNSFSRLLTFHQHIRWDIVRSFVPASLPAVWLGAWLLQYINPIYLELLMGLFLVSNVAQLFRPAIQTQMPPLSNYRLALVGFCVGFVSGLAGAVGLLFNSFYLNHGLTKEEIIATRATNEILLHIIKLILYSLFGLMTSQVFFIGAVIAAAAIASAWAMKWVVSRISIGAFKRIGYSAMVLSGVSLLSTAAGNITTQHGAALDWLPIDNGYEAKLKWSQMGMAFEFVWNEGFEMEQVIMLKDLPAAQKAWVMDRVQHADSYVIEEVFSFYEHSYELYVQQDGTVEKVDFE